MDEQTREIVNDELLPLFSDDTNWLFERRTLEGLFPILYLLYSIRHHLTTCLDDVEDDSEEETDELQEKLFNASLTAIGGDGEAFLRLQNIYDFLQEFDDETFKEMYPVLIENSLCKTSYGDGHGSALLPNQRIATTVGNILREHGCKSVYIALSGIGAFVPACQDMALLGEEPYAPANLVAQVMADAYGVKNASFTANNPLERWTRKKFDAVIGNLPVDADFFNLYRADHLLHEYNEKQDAFIRKLINSKTARKVAAVLVHFEFANHPDYDETRKLICEKKMLDTVIALPEDIFSEATVPTYLLILDMTGSAESVSFIDATDSFERQISYTYVLRKNRFDLRECAQDDLLKMARVQYPALKKCSWAFNPAVYIQNARCKEGMELVRLGDLVRINTKQTRQGRFLNPSLFSDNREKVLQGLVSSAASEWTGDCQSVNGESVLVSLGNADRRHEQPLICGVCKEKGTFHTAFYVSVLEPDTEKIIPEYLALALLSDDSFAEYYNKIQEYHTDPVRSTHLSERRIPIHTDLLVQRKKVDEVRNHADVAETIFNVVLAGTKPKTCLYRDLLEDYGCNILANKETVEGPDGLEQILKKTADSKTPVNEKVDAVVFTSDIRLNKEEKAATLLGMDAVVDLQLLYGQSGIVFMACSDKTLSEIKKVGVISPRRLRYFEEGHFFLNEKGRPSKAMASALRSDLEAIGSVESKIRSKYRDVFTAAGWIDANYEGCRVSEVLSDFLVEKDFGKSSERNLTDIRIVAHRIIDILKELKIVPDDPNLNHGAIPKLIYERKYKTPAQTTYHYWDDTVMPRTLSSSLLALIEIGNEGAHTFNSRPLLGDSMLSTLMEFVLWLFNNRNRLSQRTTPPWIKENKDETIRIDNLPITGTARKEIVNGKQIWVCESIHLQEPVDGDIREGDLVTVVCVVKETKYKTPDITAFAYNDGYTIDKAARFI